MGLLAQAGPHRGGDQDGRPPKLSRYMLALCEFVACHCPERRVDVARSLRGARDGAHLARAVDAALARLVDAVLPIRSGRELRAEAA
jgi:hypothetical protein